MRLSSFLLCMDWRKNMKKKKIKEMTMEEYRVYNRQNQANYRKRQKDTIARLKAENERLQAELKEIRGGVSA